MASLDHLSLSRVNPNRALVLVGGRGAPMGSIGTWGFEDTSYRRAMRDPRALTELRTREGLLPDDPRRLEDLVGPRFIEADHKLLTRHGGLVPESIRGDVAAYMGIGKRDKMAGRAPMGMQLQALAGARYLAGLGATLPELADDPTRLSVLASSGLPGTERFVESARASGYTLDPNLVAALKVVARLAETSTSRLDADAASITLTRELGEHPVVGRDPLVDRKGVMGDTMAIAHILGSGVATVFSNMIGPRTQVDSADPLLGARTLGAEFHHTGECATFFGSVRAAAMMLRADPEFFQVPDMVLVGAAEAGFAVPSSRILSLLFDSMGAMENTDKVFGRGADLWSGYAPLTTDVGGFWPGEGAGMVGLTTAAFAIRKRLRIVAELSALGASADQGGKSHPAALGLGGLNSLRHALKVARTTGVVPNYVNLHGTGTDDNNIKETGSLASLFGAMGYTHDTALFADKAVQTHALAAAGALALSAMLFGIVEGVLPGAANIEGRTVDPRIDTSFLRISSDPVREFAAILLRSQGFWGNNEDMVVLPIREGMLAERYDGVSAAEEIGYWDGVRERDAHGAENLGALIARTTTCLELLERVRFA